MHCKVLFVLFVHYLCTGRKYAGYTLNANQVDASVYGWTFSFMWLIFLHTHLILEIVCSRKLNLYHLLYLFVYIWL